MRYEIAGQSNTTQMELRWSDDTLMILAKNTNATSVIAWLTPDGTILRAHGVDPSLGFQLNSDGQVWEEGVDK